ncbi:hypothetical protein BDF22DRAFT_672483 [Syncephalis plumigaleata]|nr:hypothetical protein BDF22DRAFT_672483 [Syncephalis plumigaleata]
MDMRGQQWNQQHNTNMQFGSNNWNNVATPKHPNNNQGQQWNQQPSAKIKFKPAKWNKAVLSPDHPNPKTKDDIIIHFSGKYRFESLKWSKFSRHTQWQMKPTWKGQNFLVICYKGNEKYQRVKDFYDYIEGMTNEVDKSKLSSILLKRKAHAQSANKEVGCFVFELHREYTTLRAFLTRNPTFTAAKHIPNMAFRVMEAVAYLNDIGVAYNSIGGDHIMVSKDKKNNVNDIKLINFDRSLVFRAFAKSMTNGQIYEDQTVSDWISKAYLKDIKQTAGLIDNLFNAYDNILSHDYEATDPALLPQVNLYNAQRKSLWKLKSAMIKAETPYMLFNILMDHVNDYNTLVTPAIRNN